MTRAIGIFWLGVARTWRGHGAGMSCPPCLGKTAEDAPGTRPGRNRFFELHRAGRVRCRFCTVCRKHDGNRWGGRAGDTASGRTSFAPQRGARAGRGVDARQEVRTSAPEAAWGSLGIPTLPQIALAEPPGATRRGATPPAQRGAEAGRPRVSCVRQGAHLL
eukprot:gene19651-biopygen5515